MKYATIAAILILFSLMCACKDEDDGVCNVSDPVNELPWLNQEITHLEGTKASDPMYQYRFAAQASYQGKVVFFFSFCCPVCSSIPIVTLRNCAGEEVTSYNTAEGQLRFQKTIWKAEGFPCNK